MKNLSKIFIGLLILSLANSSCKKEDDVTTNGTTPTTSDTDNSNTNGANSSNGSSEEKTEIEKGREVYFGQWKDAFPPY